MLYLKSNPFWILEPVRLVEDLEDSLVLTFYYFRGCFIISKIIIIKIMYKLNIINLIILIKNIKH